MTEPTAQWTFPDIDEGDGIMVSHDPTRSDMTYAIVTHVKPNAGAVDATAYGKGGAYPMTHLWHKDDPRVQAEPERFHGVCSGVFVLAAATIARRELLERVATLEKRFAALERYVAGDTADGDTPVARRPGRPRKLAEAGV